MIPSPESYTLQFPITHQGRDYTELTVRRPKARDVLRAVKKGGKPFEMEIDQLVNLCEVPPKVIDELDLSDLNALLDILRSFGNPSEAEVRKAIMTLSVHAGWDLATLEDLAYEEIIEWLRTLEEIKPKR